MQKVFWLSIMAALYLSSGTGWCGLTQEQQERLSQLESQAQGHVISQDMLEFNKSFSEQQTGRFQAVKLSNIAVLILDTQAGHIWLWLAKGETFLLVYEGQVSPGGKMGEIIDSYQMKKARTQP